jgi:site-specific DNA-cytosine methylase
MKNNYKIASFFSGCGGLDLGFEGGFIVKSNTVKGIIL